jgi:hypothetical protein
MRKDALGHQSGETGQVARIESRPQAGARVVFY